MQKCFLNIYLAGFPLIRWGTSFQINLPKLVEQNYLRFVWKQVLPEDWRIHFWCQGHAARTLTKDSNSHIYEHWNSTNTVQMHWFLDFGIMEAIFPEKKADGPQACVYSMVTNARPERGRAWARWAQLRQMLHCRDWPAHQTRQSWSAIRTKRGTSLEKTEKARQKVYTHRCDEAELSNWCQHGSNLRNEMLVSLLLMLSVMFFQ